MKVFEIWCSRCIAVARPRFILNVGIRLCGEIVVILYTVKGKAFIYFVNVQLLVL